MIDKRRLALFPAGTFISDSANVSESILQIYQKISDTLQARFEPALNESSGFVE